MRIILFLIISLSLYSQQVIIDTFYVKNIRQLGGVLPAAKLKICGIRENGVCLKASYDDFYITNRYILRYTVLDGKYTKRYIKNNKGKLPKNVWGCVKVLVYEYNFEDKEIEIKKCVLDTIISVSKYYGFPLRLKLFSVKEDVIAIAGADLIYYDFSNRKMVRLSDIHKKCFYVVDNWIGAFEPVDRRGHIYLGIYPCKLLKNIYDSKVIKVFSFEGDVIKEINSFGDFPYFDKKKKNYDVLIPQIFVDTIDSKIYLNFIGSDTVWIYSLSGEEAGYFIKRENFQSSVYLAKDNIYLFHEVFDTPTRNYVSVYDKRTMAFKYNVALSPSLREFFKFKKSAGNIGGLDKFYIDYFSTIEPNNKILFYRIRIN